MIGTRAARVAANVAIRPYVVIEEDAEIGAGSVVEARFCFSGTLLPQASGRLPESCVRA